MSQLLWTTLGIVCPTCDEHNAPRAAKCTSCGNALLEAGAPAKPAAAGAARPPAAEKAPAPAAVAKPAAAPGGTNPGLKSIGGAAPAPPAAAKPASVPGGSTNPKLPAVGAPGNSNPSLKIPASARPAAPGGPAVRPPSGAMKPMTGEPVKAPAAKEAVPPGMRPSTRHTPAHGLPPADLEPLPSVAPAVAPAAPAAQAKAVPSKFTLVGISGSSASQRFRLSSQGCQVGRSRGAILFPDDPFVSPLHALFSIREGKLFVRDEGSNSGVLVTVHQELIPPGALFAAGNHLFRYAGTLEPVPPVTGRPVVYGAPLPQALYLVEELLVGGRAGRAVVTHGPLLTIGQSLCDLSFPGEEGLAPRHCELTPTPAGAMLRDLSGGLGTYVHLAGGERALNPGDRVRIGDQILQVEIVA